MSQREVLQQELYSGQTVPDDLGLTSDTLTDLGKGGSR